MEDNAAEVLHLRTSRARLGEEVAMSRRTALAAAAVALVLAGCTSDPPSTPAGTTGTNTPSLPSASVVTTTDPAPGTTSTPATPSPTGTGTAASWGSGEKVGGSMSTAPLVDIRSGRHAGHDRLVLEVEGPRTGYRVSYVDAVIQDGSGDTVPVAGGARLQIILLSPAVDVDTSKPRYQPKDLRNLVNVSGYRTFRQVVWAGSFEGQTTVGLGVRAQLPFRVVMAPGAGGRTTVAIDVAHAW